MSVKRVLTVLAIATVLHTGVLPARPARASTGNDVAIGFIGFVGYVGAVFLATWLWNRSREPDTSNTWSNSAINPATLDRHAPRDGLRGPGDCKPDTAGMPLLCW